MFGAVHLLSLLFCAAFITIVLIIFSRSGAGTQNALIKITALLLLFTEIFKLTVLFTIGKLSIGHLPLHLCSMAIYLNLITAFSGSGVRAVLGEISLFTLLPAALMALIFPDWTMYPCLNFMNFSSYFWHSLQIIFPMMCLIERWIKPSIRHFWWNALFLLVAGIPILIFDVIEHCNYFFLLGAPAGTPLVPLYALCGTAGYIAALFLLYCLVILTAYLIFFASRRILRSFTPLR